MTPTATAPVPAAVPAAVPAPVPVAGLVPGLDWRVTAGPVRPMTALAMLSTLIVCYEVWTQLTVAQRRALLGADDGQLVACKPITVRALHRRGLAELDGQLTEAGREVRAAIVRRLAQKAAASTPESAPAVAGETA